MFHEPLDLSALDFPTAVHTLHRLLQVADAYDSLALPEDAHRARSPPSTEPSGSSMQWPML